MSQLPEKDLSSDSNYYDWMKDIWLYVEPAYAAFYAWAKQRCEGEITDLGCGDGNVGRAIGATHFYDYIQAEEWIKPIDLMSSSIPPLQGDTFILSHVLEHLTDPKTALKNLFTALKSGDRLIICVPNGNNPESTALPFQQYIPSNDGTAKHIHHVYAWTSADLYNTLLGQGWVSVEIATANVCGFDCIWALAIKP
ncbi:MAG: class I SAM-dependent methyltransferase [Richelia sp. RM2_1_2]|nr:class I SAM-dependent methyltransferase [Richelia sp. RM2_1_2]